jgi:hypothetical protein
MSFTVFARRVVLGIFALALIFCASSGQAQNNGGTLRGTVTDPSGGAVVGATVTVTSSGGQATTATSNNTGAYEIRGLAPGTYQLSATASGFQAFSNPSVAVAAGQFKSLDIPLSIQVEQQQVQVNAEAQALDVSPENNADAIVIKGSDLDALPDDPDELQSDLEALAGPSIGPNGGQMYIDGFTAGELPPKSSIREIRINSNPFTAEFDSLGFGRIEIFTKAGGGSLHGNAFVLGNSKDLNTADPYVNWIIQPNGSLRDPVPGYYTVQYNGSIGGSLGKNTSWFISAQQRRINDAELGLLYDPTAGTGTQSGTAISNPRLTTQISPQIEYNLSKNNTITFRYSYNRNSSENNGISEFIAPTSTIGNLNASATYNSKSYEHSVQVSDTQVFGAKLVMDTRFQFNDDVSSSTPSNPNGAPTITAPDLTIGGYSGGANSSTAQNYELQNYFTFTTGKHTMNFGARSRDFQSDSTQVSGFNGSFAFQTAAQFQAAAVYLAANPNATSVPAADAPYSLSITTTSNGGFASANEFDIGAFFQEDYRWKPNITLSAGLRFESQTDIQDHRDWGPRAAVSWGVGKTKTGSPAFVLRGGWGIFYNRFGVNNIVNLERNDGVEETHYLLYNPTCFPSATNCLSQLTSGNVQPSARSLEVVAPNFRVPYTMEAAFSVEHQLTRNTTLTVNYLNGRGVHQQYTTNINAPTVASDFAQTSRPLYSLYGQTNVMQFTPGGIFKQNLLSVTSVIRATNRLTLNANYTLNYANGTASSVIFENDPALDYGRAAFDTRHRLLLTGTITLPRTITLSPFMTINSGSPYSVGGAPDYLLNGGINRPILTSQPTNPGPNQTIYAFPGQPQGLNLNNYSIVNGMSTYNGPLTEQAIVSSMVPINYLTGPGNISFNLRVAKTFAFGRRREATNQNNVGPGGGPGGPGGGPGGPGGGPGGPGGGPGGGGPGGGPGGGGFGGGGGGRGGGGFGGGGFGGGGGGRGGRGGAAASAHRYTVTLSANARNLFNVANAGPRNGNDAATGKVLEGGTYVTIPLFERSTALAQSGATTTYDRQISLQATFNF